jgi:hypothetical protein
VTDLLARLEGDGKARRWIKRHLDYADQDWCLLWPFSRIQSGYAGFGRPWVAVHRLMCEVRNGPPPTPKHQAAHSCGRGPDGCVNPWHLSWKTNAENQLERYQHSGRVPRAKLKPEQVLEIRSLQGLAKVDDLAKRFSVTALTIHRIHAGKLWKDASCLQRRVLTEAEVIAIRTTPYAEKSLTKWAKELGVTTSCVDRVRNRRSYNWVPDPATSILKYSSQLGNSK